jgi:TrmH family RNA methyltransferase
MSAYELLNQVRIVLVDTSHPGNIGAAARAMKTMGLSRLYLVTPQQYPHAEATARASGADDVLARAIVCGSLSEALSGCILVAATSARPRRLQSPSVTPAEVAAALLQQSAHGDVALVFGRERSGLTNEELDLCQLLVSISANPDYSSLNLAAAVQILSYELRRILEQGIAAADTADSERPATADEMEGLHAHWQQTLIDIRVLATADSKPSLQRRLRLLFGRAFPSATEVNILRGILRAVQRQKPKPAVAAKPKIKKPRR